MRYVVAALTLLFFPLSLQAQMLVLADADSASPRTYPLDEVVISATRIPQTLSGSPSPVTIVTRADIENSNATSLAGIIAPAAGIFIKDYGSEFGLKTLAQRGLGPEHTLVLVNGVRMNSSMNGLVDLGLVRTGDIERVELLRGGHSASFGSDALAGVINVVTRPAGQRQSVGASVSAGSFGRRAISLSGEAGVNASGIRARFDQEEGNEDFPLQFRNGSTVVELTRRNSDFRARSLHLQGRLGLNALSEVVAYIRTMSAERGVAGPVVSPYSVSVARQTDRENVVQLGVHGVRAASLRYRFNAQVQQNYQRYVDASLNVGGVPVNTYSNTLDTRLESGLEWVAGAGNRFALGGELDKTTVEGNTLKDDRERRQFALYIAGDHILDPGDGLFAGLEVFPALRYDLLASGENRLAHWSPQLGARLSFNFAAMPALKPSLRANWSKSFRAPTFNELYYAGGGGIGNPHLGPERSTGYDVGADIAVMQWGRHDINCSYFNIAMSDRILWISVNAGTVTPRNIRAVSSEGIEFSYAGKLPDDLLMVNVNYTFTRAVKSSEDSPGDKNVSRQLVYVPRELANIQIAWNQKYDDGFVRQCGWAGIVSYTGFRYHTEDNTEFLPSYWLAGANAHVRCDAGSIRLLAKLDINNLLGREYQVFLGYPMPGRSYKVTFAVEY